MVSSEMIGVIVGIVVTIAASIYGFAKGDWSPLAYMVFIILLVLLFYNVFSCFDDRLDPSNRTKLFNSPNGDVEVEIVCTKYLMGNGAIYIDINEARIGKIHRGGSARILLPAGTNRISIYRSKKAMVIEEGLVEKGCSLLVWSDNSVFPKYHVTILNRDAVFDESDLMASYEKIRKYNIDYTRRGVLFGVPPLIMMFLAMKFFFGLF
ncbi:MAG: hypothetical protein FWH45_00335 [Methanomassiliicoccaceae archaeon]|nr:hypothetical protein [Methanomassiliicoccaceae archaeon]MCL2145623.1 hypothetical protein [Methanomassiliicoccaceae archaeon]